MPSLEMIKRKLAHYPAYYDAKKIAYDFRILKKEETIYPAQFRKLGATFIHIPKCAGNALTDAIYGLPSVELGGHATAIELRNADPKEFNKSFKFTVTRHPSDRFLSAFYFLKSGGMTQADKEWASAFIPENMTLDRFCESLLSSKLYRRQVKSFIHFIPQHHYICDKNKNVLIDFIGHHEKISDDYQKIRERIGYGKPLKSKNVTGGRQQNNHGARANVQEVVRTLYAHDFEILGYSL